MNVCARKFKVKVCASRFVGTVVFCLLAQDNYSNTVLGPKLERTEGNKSKKSSSFRIGLKGMDEKNQALTKLEHVNFVDASGLRTRRSPL